MRIKKSRKIAVGLAVAAIVGSIAAAVPASAYNYQHTFPGFSCTGALRPAIYMAAPSWMELYQEWSGGSSAQSWNNGLVAATHAHVTPIGVQYQNYGVGSYNVNPRSNTGYDCRAWA
jgi:transcription elongation factor